MVKEQAVIAAIEKLLERRGQESKLESDDPRFSRLIQLLTVQQERNAQIEREHVMADAEDQVKQMQITRERDDERLKHLELFIVEQREAQRKQEAMWKEERTEMDKRAREIAQEARDLAAKDIAAAQSAREAAQNALNFAKAEGDKRAQEHADAIAAEERKKVEDQNKEQLRRHEELLRLFREQSLKLEQDDGHSVRRTRIAEGNRSVDVLEYSPNNRDPSRFASFSPLRYVQEEIGRFDARLGKTDNRVQFPRPRRDSFCSSVPSLQSLRTSFGNENNPSVTGAHNLYWFSQ
jgi:hypothetical protein